MKQSRFTDEQIIVFLKQADADMAVTANAVKAFPKTWHSPNSVDKYYCQNLNGRNANAKSQIHI